MTFLEIYQGLRTVSRLFMNYVTHPKLALSISLSFFISIYALHI